MKKTTIVALLIGLLSSSAYAIDQKVFIGNAYLGSGYPGVNGGYEEADKVANGIYIAPQYLPGYPTAAVIFPRVIDVDCKIVDGNAVCNGYTWRPEYGRGEYLFFRTNFPQNVPANVIVNDFSIVVKKKVTE